MSIYKIKMLFFFGALIATIFFFVAVSAYSADFSADGGFSYGSGSGANPLHSLSPVVGAEYTFHLTPGLSLGGFYDHTFLSYVDGGTGAIHFMGGVLRAGLPGHGFLDLKVGLTKLESNEAGINPVTTNVAIGAEMGVGYEIKLSDSIGLTPRAAVRFLPDPTTTSAALRPSPTGGVMLTFHF
jgi:hypothetical protein